MCRQIDLRLRHVGPRCGPTARPKRAPPPRRLSSGLRRGKASPQRGNEEKRALAAGEAASRVRRPAEALLRPTVRRLGCGTPARRGGGASPTTYRGMCRARGAGRRAKTRGCGTTRPKKGEGRAAELDQGGHTRPRSGPQPGGTLLGAAACSGRDPDGVLVYAERVVGRARRPSQRASTVAPTEAAGLEGRDGAGGTGGGRSQRSEKGECLWWSRALRLGAACAEAPSSNRTCGFPAYGFPCETGIIGLVPLFLSV